MTFTILTLFPELFEGFLKSSILGRALEKGLLAVRLVDIRDFAADRHRICDDYAYGGGPGMVMKAEPISAALEAVGAMGRRVVYLTPAGRPYSQGLAREFSTQGEIVLICGRYEGIDQRVIDAFVTDEVSVGDYVLSGGEVAAMAVVDSTARLVDGVIAKESLEEESFGLGMKAGGGSEDPAASGSAAWGLLEYPHYTRPEVFRGMKVPEVLLSGHHEMIRKWRLEKSVQKTMRYRPDLLSAEELPREIQRILREQESSGKESRDGRDKGR
jgi:tRNA (guanine37-N1)-methyltransferase